MKERIDNILKETNGVVIYCEQFIQILEEVGLSVDESNIVRKYYAKRHIDKIKEFELQLTNRLGQELADYVISKISGNSHMLYWKSHEDAYLMCNNN